MLVKRRSQNDRTIINIDHQSIGGDNLTIIAGPCSIESEDQIHHIAQGVAQAGATILRGGAFKPRTSPYDFQGLGKKALQFLGNAARANNLLCISELMDIDDLDLFLDDVHIIQIGSRNMQNFSLLKQLSKIKKPVMLKRGYAATYQEFLMAAEYLLQGGNDQVILCERGIRTFEPHTRNTLDMAAIPVLQELSHLPVIVDPSHATGIRHLVTPMALAAIAAGANGIMVEVHPQPEQSISDANQAISIEDFAKLMQKARKVACAVEREIAQHEIPC